MHECGVGTVFSIRLERHDLPLGRCRRCFLLIHTSIFRHFKHAAAGAGTARAGGAGANRPLIVLPVGAEQRSSAGVLKGKMSAGMPWVGGSMVRRMRQNRCGIPVRQHGGQISVAIAHKAGVRASFRVMVPRAQLSSSKCGASFICARNRAEQQIARIMACRGSVMRPVLLHEYRHRVVFVCAATLLFRVGEYDE